MNINKKEEGFVLMESLVSLSILALFIGIVLPFFIELFYLREQAKMDVEGSRFLYESAVFWDPEKEGVEQFSSMEINGLSKKDKQSITIYLEGKENNKTTIKKIEWFE